MDSGRSINVAQPISGRGKVLMCHFALSFNLDIEFEDRGAIAFEVRILQPLVWFGLLDR